MRVVLGTLALVTGLHAALWIAAREEVAAPPATHRLSSVSLAPYEPDADPERQQITTRARIRKDIETVAPITKAVRLYASTGGLEQVPAIAADYGLKVSAGIWLDKDLDRNEREMTSGIEMARKNSNVTAVIVGNEAIYRDDVKPQALIDYIRRVKAETNKPVTTGEIWHVWLEYPELANSVDFIAAHILPFWEAHSADAAVDQAVTIYNRLRTAFPGKHIVIAEFGWPSAGYNFRAAVPSPISQATILRSFLARADALGIDYNIIEAIDQPWKIFEGSVGPYWGLFDADRKPKFPLSGPITNPRWVETVAAALLMGLLLSVPVLRLRRPTFAQCFFLASIANGIAAWAALLLLHWTTHYFVFGAAVAMIGGSLLLIPLAVTILARMEELASIAFGRQATTIIPPSLAMPEPWGAPKVSIHIPAYREPPQMLIQTLNSVAALDYENFECIVVINNTSDPALWMPVAEHCASLGERFRFLNVERLEGFKAGALRLAHAHAAPDAAIIGILDADYTVDPGWLRELVPHFADPAVGLVQAPQDHRDGARSVLHDWMNTEYAGFFDIGMVERSGANAIIVHGTMCLVRRLALEQAGGWSSDTICEDSDLGLTILEAGWRAEYCRKRYGFGLLPDQYESFRKQRHRWAFGGMQIVQKHLGRFIDGTTHLTGEQRREFLLGWLNWMGAESVGIAIVLLNLIWVPVVAFGGIAIPEMWLTAPVIAAFVLNLVHFFALYRIRVTRPAGSTIGAAITAMSVQLVVARAVFEAVAKQHMAFVRTAKGGGSRWSDGFPAFWEAILAFLLLGGAVLLVQMNPLDIFEINLFACVLVVQSLPFVAAVGVSLLERSAINEPGMARRYLARMLPAPLAGARLIPAARPVQVREPAPAIPAQANQGEGIQA